MYKILVLFLLLISLTSKAQKFTISGYIMDIESNEKLINASIYEVNTKKGTISNNYGYYSLNLTADQPLQLIASYVGYTSDTLSLELLQNEKYNFLLVNENVLDEVIIKVNREKPIEQRNDMGVVSISINKINKLPAIGGESDITKTLQLMPGIQSGKEGSSSLFVRGGSPDQNLILLDDVPLYYVNHLGGFVSVFNTDAIKDIKLLKGGFPASYGGRLSSVVDIRMKEGNAYEFKGIGMVGMIASKVSVEGPIKNAETTYIFSTRRMLYDLIDNAVNFFSKQNEITTYRFYDINAKINHKISDNNHLYFSLYFGDDKIIRKEYSGENKTRTKTNDNKSTWGNTLYSLRWNHLFSQQLFSNLTLSYTHFGLMVDDKNTYKDTESSFNYKSGIYDTNIKIDFDYFLHPNYSMKFGVIGTHHKFNPGTTKIFDKENTIRPFDIFSSNKKIESNEFGVYLENKVKLGQQVATNIGIRYNTYFVNGTIYQSFEPRLLFNWNLYKNSSIKLSYATMQQNVHLLTTGGAGMPVDLWMPATANTMPEKSKQFAIGFSKSTTQGKYEFSLESYYKITKGLVNYKEGQSVYTISGNWENDIEKNGLGKAYGIELLLQKKRGRHTGWISYTLAKSERQFDNLNFGKTFPYRYDKRHDISLVYQYRIFKNINLSSTWSFASGGAISIPEARYYSIISDDNLTTQDIDTSLWNNILYYNGKNGFRMRPFHKLDIGVSFRKETKWGERTWNISIYNVYNRQNPYFYFFVKDFDYNHNGIPIEGSSKLQLMQQSLFPILPSVSYSFKF